MNSNVLRYGANVMLNPWVSLRRYSAVCSNQKAKQSLTASPNGRAIDQETTRALSTPYGQIYGWHLSIYDTHGIAKEGKNVIFLDRHDVKCGANEAITFFRLTSRAEIIPWLSYGMIIALKGGRDGKYCSSCSTRHCSGFNENVQCNRDRVHSEWERWRVLDGGNGKVIIKGMAQYNEGKAQNLYWTDEENGNLNPSGTNGDAKNIAFTVHDRGYPLIAFQGGNQNKYCRDEGGNCRTDGSLYLPLDMDGQGRTVTTPAGCRKRCRDTDGCKFFNSFPNGGCHITTGADGTKMWGGNPTVLSGNAQCVANGVRCDAAKIEQHEVFTVEIVSGGTVKYDYGCAKVNSRAVAAYQAAFKPIDCSVRNPIYLCHGS